jgi:hypothetical protein
MDVKGESGREVNRESGVVGEWEETMGEYRTTQSHSCS